MRAKTIDILKEAKKGGYAVGAFNISNMELAGGVARAAASLHRPCIIQASTNAMSYAGHKVLGALVQSIIENDANSTPIGFHLDHGHSLDDVERAIEMGVDSVMIDGSTLSLKENIKLTKRVVDLAHSKGVSVQAELGKVPYLGREELVVNWDDLMTQPEEAKILVQETGIDALAIGIGNAHGFFREKESPDWDRLKEVRKLLPDIPLILHGASDWNTEKVRKAIAGGINCFNIDTDIRVAFATELCRHSAASCDVSDPRKVLAAAREKVKEKVREKITLFMGK